MRVVLFFALLKQRPRSPSRLVLRTPAKVNLALEVLRKRPDGYHELSTVLQAVDLCDRLTVETADTITLETSEPGLPTDERNLVVRAARMLRDAAGVDRGARIRLEKRIPLAAGLGGGWWKRAGRGRSRSWAQRSRVISSDGRSRRCR